MASRPSFNRTLIPDSRGLPVPTSGGTTRPYMPNIKDPFTAPISNLAEQIQNIGRNMIDRHSSISANGLSNQFREDLAKFSNGLNVDDYALWQEKTNEYAKQLLRTYDVRAKESGITKEHRAQLTKRLSTDATNASNQALNSARQTELKVIPKRLSSMIKQTAKSLADTYGIGQAPKIRESIQDMMDAIQGQVDLIGTHNVKAYQKALFKEIEVEQTKHRIFHDPQSIVDGGIDQFVYIDGGTAIRQAETRLSRMAQLANLGRKDKKARLERDTDTLIVKARHFDADSSNFGIVVDSFNKELSAMAERIVEYNQDYPNNDDVWFEGKVATIKALRAFSQVSINIAVGNQNYARENVEAFKDWVVNNDDPSIVIEGDKLFSLLDDKLEERIEFLDHREVINGVVSKDISPTDSRVLPALEALIFDKPLTEEQLSDFGVEALEAEEGAGNTSATDLMIEKRYDRAPDGSLILGVGHFIGEGALKKFGNVPESLIAYTTDILSTDKTAEANIRRSLATAALARFSGKNRTLHYDLDKDIKDIINAFNSQGGVSSDLEATGRYLEALYLNKVSPDAFNLDEGQIYLRNILDKITTPERNANLEQSIKRKLDKGIKALIDFSTFGEVGKMVDDALTTLKVTQSSNLLFTQIRYEHVSSDDLLTDSQMEQIVHQTNTETIRLMDTSAMTIEVASKQAIENVTRQYTITHFPGGSGRHVSRMPIDSPEFDDFGTIRFRENDVARTIAEFIESNPSADPKMYANILVEKSQGANFTRGSPKFGDFAGILPIEGKNKWLGLGNRVSFNYVGRYGSEKKPVWFC